MIIVTSLDNEIDKYNNLVPFDVRIKYRSFLDILNSLDVIDKYVVSKEGNYTHEYDNVKMKDIVVSNNDNFISKKEINLNYNTSLNKHFSKGNNKLLSNDEISMMEYGTKIHEILEYASFKDRKNKYVNKLLDKIDNNFMNVYKEYEFIYSLDGIIYNGVIDLMLEYDNYINIIDYKLKNIDDEAYVKQLNGYKDYIESISNKRVDIYLYSILNDELKRIN